MRHRLELGGEGHLQPRFQLRDEVGRQWPAPFGFDLAHTVVGGATEKAREHLLRRDRIAEFSQESRMFAAGDDLAVDQNAITIEDDEEPFLIGHRPYCRNAQPKASARPLARANRPVLARGVWCHWSLMRWRIDRKRTIP